MVTKKQRKFYAIFVGIFFTSGVVIYGLLAFFANFSPLIIYIFLGGLLLGGLASGGILFGRYITRRSPIVLKILCIVFFPITLYMITIIGVFPLIPYYIHNLISLVRKEPERISISVQKSRKNPMIAVIALCALLLLALIQFIINSITEANIAQSIYTETGFPAGSADNVIIRSFFYNEKDSDYAFDMEYDYEIINGMLFAIANNESKYSYKIFYQNSGAFSISDKYQRYYYSSGKYMRSDIDEMFSKIQLVKNGDLYAFILLIDARTDDEHIADYISGIKSTSFNDDTKERYYDPVFLQFTLDQVDRTYANLEKIELYDENGEPLARIELDGGRYVAFCDTIRSGNKEYNVTVSYEGDTFTLLTYDDIINFRIGS